MNHQQPQAKAVVSVSEMARMVGLSRARFYQLIGTAFPHPLYDVATRRPFYVQVMQETCLEVRRKNCGIDGRPILFYTTRNGSPPPIAQRRKSKDTSPRNDQHDDLLDALKALGLVSVTTAQVAQVVKELFPTGTANNDQAEVIRTVFVHLKRQDSTDKVG